MENFALASDSRDDSRRSSSALIGRSELPSATIPDSISHQRHRTIQKTGPNEIAFFIAKCSCATFVQYLQITVFRREVHFAVFALLYKAAVFGHAIAIEYACLKCRRDFLASIGIKRFPACKYSAHWNGFTAFYREIGQNA